MRATGIIVGLCVALLVNVAVRAAEPASPDQILKELEGLKKTNQDLVKRVETLETKAPAAPGEKPATPPGRFDLGGGTTIKVFGDVRVRNEYVKNGYDMNNAADDTFDWTRLRTRIGCDVDYQNKFGTFIQLANEFRWGTQNKFISTAGGRDLFVDNAYVRVNFKELWDMPFVFTAGRQDLLADPEKSWGGMYGEGWLLFDGTPFDGSTSIAFDSAKLRFTGIPNTTVDFIYAKLNDLSAASAYTQADRDEDFYAVYLISRPADTSLQAELYGMHRNKQWYSTWGTGASMIEDPESETTILGGRLSTSKPIADDHVTMALEGAYQTGSLHPVSRIGTQTGYTRDERILRDAYGAYAWARLSGAKEFKELGPLVEARFDFMSGDDPSTRSRYEGWDSMYGEWPKYSELLMFNVYDPFGGSQGGANPNLGAWSNLLFPTISLTLTPDVDPLNKDLSFKLGYRYMLAAEDNGPGTGKKFGDLLQCKIEYKITKALVSHFECDYFIPGNYFANGSDEALFARVEMMYRF